MQKHAVRARLCCLVHSLLIIPFVTGLPSRPTGLTEQAMSQTSLHTVSGVSSGGDMAMIHLLAESSHVTGVGVVAGAPYGCNILVGPGSEHACGVPRPQEGPNFQPNFDRIQQYVHDRAARHQIDALSEMQGKQVWLFSGSKDSLVHKNVMVACERQVRNFTGAGSHVATVYNVPAEHGWVVDGDDMPSGPSVFYGCGHFGPPYIMNCRWDMSRAMLVHLYSKWNFPWAPMGTADLANIVKINQGKYVSPGHPPHKVGLSRTAFTYVPTSCRFNVSACTLHVHYHGCGGAVSGTGSTLLWVELPYWAESNGIVILYPQAVATAGNENGCWDWWGFTGDEFDSHTGVQINTVMTMIADLPNALQGHVY